MPKELNGEIELIREAAAGNADAFGILLENYKDALYNFVYRMTRNASEADDIVQEAFIKAYKNLSEFKINLKFSTWLYTIALNLTRNKMKRRSLIRFLSLDFFYNSEEGEKQIELQDDLPTPEDMAVRRSEIDQANLVLKSLPEKYREVFVLRHIEELSYEEISRITGFPMGTVENRIHRANKIAAKEYQRKFGTLK